MNPTIPFDQYLALAGCSYSSIKAETGKPIVETAKMRLGTSVHTYLLTPAHYDHTDAALVYPVARAVKQKAGALLTHMIPEITVVCDFVHEGFSMPYKGRIDLGIPKLMVIDLKVTELNLADGIKHFGYDKQVSGYALAIGAPLALIIGVHPRTYKVQIERIHPNPDFWHWQVKQRGEPQL